MHSPSLLAAAPSRNAGVRRARRACEEVTRQATQGPRGCRACARDRALRLDGAIVRARRTSGACASTSGDRMACRAGAMDVGAGPPPARLLRAVALAMREGFPPRVVPDEQDNRTLFSAVGMSFLWSMGSFMVLSILPVYLRDHLGFTNTRIGALEGLAAVGYALTKGASGITSDALGSRRAVLLLGAFLTAAVKPIFGLTSVVSAVWGTQAAVVSVTLGKVLDRVGKGVRAAPLDALISDVSPPENRARAYGINYSASTLGAVAGCLVASVSMRVTRNDYGVSLAMAVVPAAATLWLLLSHVPARPHATQAPPPPQIPPLTPQSASPGAQAKGLATRGGGARRGHVALPRGAVGRSAGRGLSPAKPPGFLTSHLSPSSRRGLVSLLRAVKDLPAQFWQSLLIVCVLYLARFSESFMTIRAHSVGMSVSKLPLLLIIDQLMQSTLTYPLASLSDRFGRKHLLLFGFGLLIVANLVFMMSQSVRGIMAGYIVVGLHMSLTQSNLKVCPHTHAPTHHPHAQNTTHTLTTY